MKKKKGVSNIISTIIIILMCIILIGAVYINIQRTIKKNTNEIEQSIYAASNINLKILGVEFEGENLRILVENNGQENISGFIVRITNSNGEVYTDDSVYLVNKKELSPLETNYLLIIPAPFGADKSNYKKIEVYPKFEWEGEEETAEVSMDTFSFGGTGFSAEATTPIKTTQCNDGVDNDGDGLIDLNDLGCENSQDNEELGGLCRIDFTSINQNLVQNPKLECDNNQDNLPDNWKKNSESINHRLYWAEDTTGHGTKIIFSNFSGTGNGDENSFGWTSSIPVIKQDTWYEFSFDYATEGVEPNINLSDNTIKSSTNWMGVALLFYSSTIKTSSTLIRNADNYVWAYGPNMTEWDESAGVYRTYDKKGFENWRRVTKYIKSSSKTVYAEVKTYNYPRGKIYFDNFVLKEVPGNYNPEQPEFKKSGTLNFVKLKGQDYFPIILYGIPKQNNQPISLDLVKENGFNSVSISQYYNSLGYDGVKQLLLEKNLSAVVELSTFYPNNQKSVWVNDPGKNLNYFGWDSMKSKIDNWAGFENLLAFNGPDERDCGANSKGWYLPNLKSFELLKNYKDEKAPEAYLITNYCGKVMQEGPYTKNSEDLIKYYLQYDDILSQTLNTPQAYAYGNEDAYLNNVGKSIRKLIDNSIKEGENRPVLSFGLGVYWWSNWDGKGGWHFNQVIPFNVQRYQVWEQIINGATGVWFWGTYKIKTEDTLETQNIYGENVVVDNSYYNYHWKQITTISKELASLYPVLIEPNFYNEWQVSDSRIDIMMKKHAGKIYLFTASNHYEDINNIRITLPGYTLKKVTAINEVSNETLVQFNRTLAINSDKHSFNDNFIGDYDSSKNIKAPGYAVHIYEIEYT